MQMSKKKKEHIIQKKPMQLEIYHQTANGQSHVHDM